MNEELINPASVDFIGSSGTLIAAALETVGYYYQSIIMDAMSRGVAGSQSAFVSLGALFFVVGAMVALVNVIVMGKYKFTAWLLVGPTIFYACVFSRIETSGSAWIFGSEERSSELLRARVADTLGREGVQTGATPNYKPRVSGVFAWYNKLVSGTVKEIVRVINQNKSSVDTSFFVRTQLYHGLGDSQIDDPGLKELIHEGFFGQCRKQMEYGRKMRDLRYSNDDRVFFANRYMRLALKRVVKPKELSKEYIGLLYAFYPSLFAEKIVVTAAAEQQNALTADGEYRLRVFDNGEQVKERSGDPMVEPMLADRAVRMDESKAFTEEFVDGEQQSIDSTTGSADAISGVLDEVQTVDQANEIKTTQERDGTVRNRELMRKFINEPDVKKAFDRLKQVNGKVAYGLFKADLGGLSSVTTASFNQGAYSCHEVWQLIYASLHWQGLIKLRQAMHQGIEVGAKAGDQIRFLHDMMVATRYYRGDTETVTTARDIDDVLELEDAIVNAIAKKLFKNEAMRGSISARIASLTAGVNRNDHIEVEQESGLEELEANRLSNTSWQDKMAALGAIESMPYYQGIILYFLAVLFPFFTLLLLIPGKHSGFFLWFILWFWVKSWDIAFAIVMMLDDVLHAIFIQGMQVRGGFTGLERELSLASLSLQEQDPTFHPTVYYSIMSVAFKSIPVVTSYFVLGAMKGGGGIIAEGMTRYTSADNSIGRVSGISGVGQAVTAGGALWNVKADLNQRRVDGLQDQIDADQGGAAGTAGGAKPFRGEAGFLRSKSNYFGEQKGIRGLGDQYVGFEWNEGFGHGLRKGGTPLSLGDAVGISSDLTQGRANELGPVRAKTTKRNLKNLNRAFNKGKPGLVTGVVQGIGAGVSQWYSMKSDTTMRTLNARLGIVTTWADHDITGDLKGHRAANDMILHGSIPIFSTTKVDHLTEAKRILSDFENDLQYYEGVAEVASTAVSTTSNLIEGVRDRSKKK